MYHAAWDKQATDACLATFKAIIGYLMSKLGPEAEFFAVAPFENSTAPDSQPLPPPFVAEHLFSVKPGFQVEVKLGSEWLAASILKIAGPGETIYEGYTLQDGHMLLQFVYQGLRQEAWYDRNDQVTLVRLPTKQSAYVGPGDVTPLNKRHKCTHMAWDEAVFGAEEDNIYCELSALD